ncbi:ankyrin repeat-containing domain protein [Halenospora varia]|nr:ankyrin repeat-containing domain protein [Halenospora varia]
MMANLGEGESNGKKATRVALTEDEAEKGGRPPHEKKGTGLSMFGPKKASSMRDEMPPSGTREAAPAARPNLAKRRQSPSLHLKSLPSPSGRIRLSLKAQRDQLCQAVTGGDTEALIILMDTLRSDDMLESAGFATQDASGNGLLQIASLHGHLDVLDKLLDKGININGVDRNHGTALQAAIYMGRTEICRRLLDPRKPEVQKDPPPQQFLKPPNGGQLTLNAQEKMNKSVREKIDVNTKGGYYGCALQVAAYRANADLVLELVRDHGAKVNLSGGKYGYPLQAAVRTGRRAVVRHILSKCDIEDVNARGGKYGTALQAVARGRYRTRMSLLEISRGQVLKQPAMSAPGVPINRADTDAREAEYVEVANMLFSSEAQLYGGIGRLENPINASACSGSVPMLELMLSNFDKRSVDWTEDKTDVLTKALLSAITQSPENQKRLVEVLITSGASIQYKISANLPNLPLEAAATKNLLEVVDFLLKTRDNANNFANTLAESGIHGTALRAAIAGSKPGREDVAECLINRIAEQWELKEASPTDGSNVRGDVPDETEGTSSPVFQPIKRKSEDKELDWTQWDVEYGNLLQLATFAGLKKTVSLLLKYGADPNVRDTSQRTALHIAAWSGFPQIVQLLLDKKLPKKQRADASLKDEWGATPLDQAEESLDRDGHPGATEQDLQEIVQILRRKVESTDIEQPGMEFRGPKKKSQIASSIQEPQQAAKPVFSMPYWIPGVGFRATIVDIWESKDQEYLLLKKPRIEEILYHKAVLDSIMTPPGGPAIKEKDKLRWIHIPANNMTWAEMLITSLCKERGLPAYKSLWGTDPFYTSSDLSPHARFIAPQCGALIPDGPIPQGDEKRQSPLFMAMPYIHWEAHRARKSVSEMITKVKREALKTKPTQNNKPLWLSEKTGSNPQTLVATEVHGHVALETTELEQVILDSPDSEEDYFELLRRYLYKRRPVHLRRTLDQYYYSHLADTNDRDLDQVVMRQFNEDKKDLKLGADLKYEKLQRRKRKLEEDDKHPDLQPTTYSEVETGVTSSEATAKATLWQRLVKKLGARRRKEESKDVDRKLQIVDHMIYYDENSPVLMIDQLWLWIIDGKTIVTSFPHRLFDRNSEDLDATDKTDILKAIVSYLHNARRPEINSSHSLADLIISQCVGILHKAEMIPDLDFLKKYSVQSNKWADQVMQMLSKFVRDFEEFMIWIKEQPAESEESIRWFESIFSVTDQTQLLRNIQDIKDELGMLKAVFDDQIQVLNAAGGLIEQADFQCVYGCHKNEGYRQRCRHSSKTFVDQSLKHLKHVERMQVQANQAYDTLKDLLNLKQQQAYVLEARVSRNEAISSGEQSKTIMVFTIVTIIFLPLTFVTTIFTLPIAEFSRVVQPDGADFPATAFLQKSYVIKYIIAITFAVAVPLIIAAFEIQPVHNGWKKLRLKMAENRRQKKRREMRPEDDGMPNFLKQRNASMSE